MVGFEPTNPPVPKTGMHPLTPHLEIDFIHYKHDISVRPVLIGLWVIFRTRTEKSGTIQKRVTAVCVYHFANITIYSTFTVTWTTSVFSQWEILAQANGFEPLYKERPYVLTSELYLCCTSRWIRTTVNFRLLLVRQAL